MIDRWTLQYMDSEIEIDSSALLIWLYIFD